MSSYNASNVIAEAIATAVVRAGTVALRTLPETDEQVALDIIDALEAAGYRIVPDESGEDEPS